MIFSFLVFFSKLHFSSSSYLTDKFEYNKNLYNQYNQRNKMKRVYIEKKLLMMEYSCGKSGSSVTCTLEMKKW